MSRKGFISFKRYDKKAVRMGDVQTINDTLEASVIPSAVFSVRKYIVPPHSPAKSNKTHP